jgi:hypothetical protein
MTSEFSAISLILIFFLAMLKAYKDWSGFEKRVRHSRHVVSKDAQKTAAKLSAASFIAGVALSLLAVTVRLASSSDSTESIEPFLYLLYVLSCSAGWVFILVISFVLKVITLKSLYKDATK